MSPRRGERGQRVLPRIRINSGVDLNYQNFMNCPHSQKVYLKSSPLKVLKVVTSKTSIQKLISAVGHNSLVVLIDQFLRMAKGIILARLLLPEDFGIFAIALSISSSFRVLSEIGLMTRDISRPSADQEEEKKWLDTIWTIELIRGLVLCLVLMVSARLFAGYFDNLQLVPIILLVALIPASNGLSSPGMYAFEKTLQYRPIAIRESGASFGGFLVTIILAILTRDAVALALGLLAQSCISALLSYKLAPFRPRLRIDKAILIDCFNYGKHLLAVGILTYVTTQVDNIFVGKFAGLEQLGYYLLAYNLAMMPVTLLSQIVSRVVFPLYSEAWNDGNHELAYQRWVKTSALTMSIVAVVTLVLWTGRSFLIPFIYGARWIPATTVFGVLTFVGLFRGLTHTTSPMLLAMQRPDMDAKVKAVEAALFVLLLYRLTPAMGMEGAAYAGLASYLVAFIARYTLIIRQPEVHAGHVLKEVAGLALCFTATALSMKLLQPYLHPVINMTLAFIVFVIYGLLLNNNLFNRILRITNEL
jgi:O-antigen/teichoic acid export membrane protein